MAGSGADSRMCTTVGIEASPSNVHSSLSWLANYLAVVPAVNPVRQGYLLHVYHANNVVMQQNSMQEHRSLNTSCPLSPPKAIVISETLLALSCGQ